MNRRGVELTVNFIVLLVLSVAGLGFALAIASKLFIGADEVASGLGPDITTKLDEALSKSGYAVYPGSADVRRGEDIMLGVGIRSGEARVFTTIINVSAAFAQDQSPIDYNLSRITVTALKEHDVAAQGKVHIPVVVDIPSDVPGGTYVFTTMICSQEPCAQNSSEAILKSYLRVQ